jgi:hypothetical protein
MKRIAQCHCGALRLTVVGEPAWVNLCHCQACQRRTGAVVHAGSYFAAADVRIEGHTKTYQRSADSGHRIRFHFCPDCGSNVYWEATRFSRHLGIAVGAFADPDFPSPTFSVWEQSMHPWLSLECELEHHSQGRVGRPSTIKATQKPRPANGRAAAPHSR